MMAYRVSGAVRTKVVRLLRQWVYAEPHHDAGSIALLNTRGRLAAPLLGTDRARSASVSADVARNLGPASE